MEDGFYKPFFVAQHMSKNNQIKKSDKKFIRREKARIRVQFLDFKKQKEMIDQLYSRFIKESSSNPQEAVVVKSVKVVTESKTAKPKKSKSDKTIKKLKK